MKFFIPTKRLPKILPSDWLQDWSQLGDSAGLTFLLYFSASKMRIDCELTNEMPTTGIVISHAEFLQDIPRPGADLYVISLQLDWPRSLWAQAHLVANRQELKVGVLTVAERFSFPGPRYFLTHMPQIGLKPRDPARRARFERLGYFGLEKNLAPPFRERAWAVALQKLGLEWCVATAPEQWSDYTNFDAVLAIRKEDHVYQRKPAQKLYNAWLGGLIPILGPEIGFREERRSPLDFIEVGNASEALAAIKRLKNDPALCDLIRQSGSERGRILTPELVAADWAMIFKEIILPEARRWLEMPLWKKQGFFLTRGLRAHMRTRKNG
ncbi:MAG: hypothetical protein WCO94_04900 [Verrucomicrobiota bacterium]